MNAKSSNNFVRAFSFTLNYNPAFNFINSIRIILFYWDFGVQGL
jgi:hypothetical protein